jgi:hypothetical protein
MKLVERGEILGLAEYEAVRERFRARVIAEKKLRRMQLGPKATAVFESHDTMLMQIQEMLRTERITRAAAVQHEIDTYNELVPGSDELSATVMIEIVDKDEREAFLRDALGFEKHVWLTVSGVRLQARPVDRGGGADRTTAVHYLKFPLPSEVAGTLRAANTAAGAPEVALEVDHPAYAARVVLPRAAVASIAEDLRDDA